MSETDTPLDPNPSSGGSPASPASGTDLADLPPPPPEPTGEENLEDTTAMLARASIGDDEDEDLDVEGRGVAVDVGEDEADDVDAEDDLDDDEEDEDMDDEDDDDQAQDMMSMLPPKVVRRVEKLRELHTEREKIMEEYLKARAQLERMFASRCKPLYARRLDVISGKLDEEIEAAGKGDGEGDVDADAPKDDGDAAAPKDPETEEGGGDATEADGGDGAAETEPDTEPAAAAAPDEDEEDDDEENIVGIPQFWVCAMGHMEAIAELITERDVDCLEHLHDVTCDDDEDGKGFTLRFHFGPNDYFHDEVLVKRYEIPNLVLDDEPILKNVTGCDIAWKEGQSLVYREVKKKQRSKSGKKAGQIRTIIKRERTDSFFHFFNPPKMPSMNDMDEEEADALEEAFDHDYDVAQAFRSHIIPKAVLWFTGEALDENMDELFDGGNWHDGEDGEQDAPAAASPFPSSAEGGENPECKQS